MRLLLILFLPWILKSQDTLYYSDNSKEVVQILEVGAETVKYKWSSNPDGPVFVKLKTEISRICFANGEYLKMPPNPVKTSKGQELNTTEVHPLIYEDRILHHNGKPLGDSRLKSLIVLYPDPAKKQLLLTEYDKMKKYRKRQYIWGIVGPVIGAYIAGIGMSVALLESSGPGSVTGPSPVVYLAVGLGAGASVLAVSLNQSQTNKKKRLDQKLKIATLYNDY